MQRILTLLKIIMALLIRLLKLLRIAPLTSKPPW
jgi:hypothetical protein